MIVVGLALAFLLASAAGLVRAGGSSLLRTARADALKDAGDGRPGAGTIARLLEDRSGMQPALGTTVMALTVLAVIPMTWAITDSLSGTALGVSLVTMTALLLLLVDVFPRWVGRNRPGSVAYRLSLVLSAAIAFGTAAADLIADPDDESDTSSDAESSDAEEREMIMSVIEFTDTIVREVMVPRTDMVTLEAIASTNDAVDIVLSSGRSRVPVIGDSVDNVVGVVYARDLLELLDRESPVRTAESISHEAYFVPETKPIAELLREMQSNQQHMAIVIDEFGGTAGLVTIEDLIEELVGEIADEYDDEEPMIVQVGDAWLVDARLDVDDLADLVGVDLPSGEWDTVGGLVLGLAGRVPEEGESFTHDGLTFVADSVRGRRVSKVRVSRS